MSTVTHTTKALPTGVWQLDPVHSRVEFAVDYMVGTFRGTFAPFQAELKVADGEATLTGSARAESVQVTDENLSAHLRSPDFFDAERAPELTFDSTGIARSGDGVTIEGELTIKGVAQPVTLTGTIADPITDPFGRERIGLDLQGTIDRSSFGIVWNNPLPTGEPSLANDVSLSAELFLVKA